MDVGVEGKGVNEWLRDVGVVEREVLEGKGV
jgi:hypothetical protein